MRGQGSAEQYHTPPPDHFGVVLSFNQVFDNLRESSARGVARINAGKGVEDPFYLAQVAEYFEIVEAIRRVTGRVPKIGVSALPTGLETYLWLNEFTSTKFRGRRFRQWEGISTFGLIVFQRNFVRTTSLHYRDQENHHLEVLSRASLRYDEIHEGPDAMVGLYKEARKEQRAWDIHTNPLLDSHLPESNRDHQIQDWWRAGADIDSQVELIVPTLYSLL